jgi:hypothetical protein
MQFGHVDDGLRELLTDDGWRLLGAHHLAPRATASSIEPTM